MVYSGEIIMGKIVDDTIELSINEIEQRLKSESKRINEGTYWLVGGILVVLITIGSPCQIFAWLGIIYGLTKIINGSSQKIKYRKIMPENFLPLEIECENCGKTLELESDERTSYTYFCPDCNQNFNYPIE